MDKAEVLKLLKYLNSYYSQKFENPSDESDLDIKVNTWHDFLGLYPESKVMAATKKLISEKEWPPTPGEIMKQIEKLQMPEEEKLTGAEAWSQLVQAIQKYGRYNQKEMLDSLPERVANAARIVGLEVIYMNNDSFIQNRYINTYNQMQDRDHEREMLPGNIKSDVKRIERGKVKQLSKEMKQLEGNTRKNKS